MSRILLLAAAATLLSMTACSKNSGEAAPAAAQPAPPAVAPKATEPAAPAMSEAVPDSSKAPAKDEQPAAAKPEAAMPAVEPKPAAPVAMMPAAKAEAPVGKSATLTKDQFLALAAKGNCLACHKIESKVVGPAWQDVGAKYKGDSNAAAIIASHIKAGGSFGWKFGVMPPRGGSQLSDADVDSLAKFIASLK